jgi:cytochrome b
MLRVAVAAQAAEAAGLCVAIVLNLIDSASGDSWTTSSAVGFILIEVIFAIGWAWIASGIARVRPWSRTPAVMSQVFTAIIALWLLEAHRYAWGIPAVALAVAGCVGLLAPASLRALSRPGE